MTSAVNVQIAAENPDEKEYIDIMLNRQKTIDIVKKRKNIKPN